MASEQKKTFVQQLTESIKEYPLIGMLNIQSLPAPQMQKMRALLLKNQIKIVMARKKLLERALEESRRENILTLKEKIKGMPALLFSKTNPFALYKIIQKNKSPAPAKAGQVAPRDLVVKAGPTNFAPGPIISELAAVGIKTKVDAGKLSVISDTVIAKEGAVISAKVAETLKRLDIKPMEVGLSLVAAWENGLVFDARQLYIDEAEYNYQLTMAARWAVNLAMESAYTAPETIELLLQKAFREAKALSLEQHIITDVTAEEMISQVERGAKSLINTANLLIPEKNSAVRQESQDLKPADNQKLKTDDSSNPENKMNHQLKTSASEPEGREINNHPEINTATLKQGNENSKPSGPNYNEPREIISNKNNNNNAFEKDTAPKPVVLNVAQANTAVSNNDLPTAQDLIMQTMSKAFDKDNASIRTERVLAKKLSAENLVEEELKIAERELKEKTAKNKKDASIKEAEELYQKLKKTGTLRE